MSDLRVGFAGDRDISVWVLDYLLSRQVRPAALFVSGCDRATHADELISRCSYLDEDYIFRGDEFRQDRNLQMIRELNLDYVLAIHFPYIFPESFIKLPKLGTLNLHPAYLPYNRGWHTPSWAILDGTPVGATLHYVDSGIDTGDILYQKLLPISDGDTAHSLYQKLKHLELEIFEEAWPQIEDASCPRIPQDKSLGTTHKRKELLSDDIRKIELNEKITAESLIRRLRALTTNDNKESAYYEVEGRRYRIQVTIEEVKNAKDED
ncbi:MAG: hypothetical protein K8L99_35675 [Anaerolineae bacterium]|nr:hypothetical protein [Anaerolineae bacterium]